MDLEELQAFLHVVKHGSFHAAAEATGMPRTTLRRRVESLQARSGVPLLESNRQGVVLTEAGRALAGRGQAMVEEASALVSSIREIGREPSGLLRLVLPVGLPPHHMAPIFASIRSMYPRLRLSSSSATTRSPSRSSTSTSPCISERARREGPGSRS